MSWNYAAAVRAKLYGLPGSHPTATAERALILKGIDYERVDLVPPLHKPLQRLRFSGYTVPGLVIDGRHIVGSRTIVHALDRMVPSPSFFPADRQERSRVEAIETWGDIVLQPLARRVAWFALRAMPSAQLSYLEGTKLFPPVPHVVARASTGIVAWASRTYNHATEANVHSDLQTLPIHLDRIDEWIANGEIGSETINAADLQLGASLRLLLTIGDIAPTLESRPCGELALKVFPYYPGHMPKGLIPKEVLSSP